MSDSTAWVTQTDLGKRYDVGPKLIGKWLIEAGLRDGRVPSLDSLQKGLAKPITTEQGVTFFVWNRDCVIEILRHAGHRAKGSPAPAWVGPFSLRQTLDDSFEVLGADGVLATVVGESNAKKICKLVNYVWTQEAKSPAV